MMAIRKTLKPISISLAVIMFLMIAPVQFHEFEKEAIIGRLAATCYSYYGFQMDPTELLEQTMPKIAD
jgi:hypothetical protein